MMTVMVAALLPPTWADGDGRRGAGAGAGAVVVVVVGASSGSGGASRIVTTCVVGRGEGAGVAPGWTAIAAPTPPANRTATEAAQRSAALLPNIRAAPLGRRFLRGTGSLVDRRCPAQSRPSDWPDRWPNFDGMAPMAAPDEARAWPVRAMRAGQFRRSRPHRRPLE